MGLESLGHVQSTSMWENSVTVTCELEMLIPVSPHV